MKRILSFFAFVALVISFASCNGNAPESKNFQFEVQAMSFYANFTITPSDREKEYFWRYVKASELKGMTPEQYVKMGLSTESFEYWQNNDYFFTGELSENLILSPNTNYIVFACYVEEGVDGGTEIIGDIEYKEFTTLPENTLNGWFSISANEEVRFSSANIRQYEASSDLDFFFNQLIYSSSYTDYPRDLFQWGKTQLPSSVSFRVLSADEWLYLFRNRPNAEKLFAHGKIKNVNMGNDVNGLIILPDNWKTPDGISLETDYDLGIRWDENKEEYVKMGEGGYDGYAKNTFSENEWRKLEFAGAVFLPASRPSANEYGWYWSSSSVGDQYAHAFSFGKDNLYLGTLSTARMIKTSYSAIRPVRIEQYITVGPFENL